ncbi:hypothetical protein AB0B89_18360 [Sphaerisporangium sp. NPDC049002]|uniref:hypothetical protein n=1 Tax=Sphaerisporangium sp. NPDC049002 TaxID=3155392 RepID=UPI0033F28DB2
MIPANPGLVARFEHEKGGGHYFKRVEAWDEDGWAMVANDDGYLVRADSIAGFAAVAEESKADPHIGFIAGQGWRLKYTNRETGRTWTEPVIGFAFTADGCGVPVEQSGAVARPAEGDYQLILPGMDDELKALFP